MDYVIKDDGLRYRAAWVAMLVYALLYVVETSLNSFPMASLFYMLAALPMIIAILGNLSFDFTNRSRICLLLYFAMLAWMLVMCARAKFDLFYPHQYGILSYAGVVLLMVNTKPMLGSFISVGYKTNYAFILLMAIPLMTKETGVIQMMLETFSVPAAFIFLTNKYHSNRNITMSAIVLLLAFLVATLTARRNLMLTYALYIAIGGVFLMMNGKMKRAEVKVLAFLSALLLLMLALVFYMNESQGMFSKITGRASENTREEVFASFAADMLTSGSDVIVGRGMSGEYYCPGVDFIDDDRTESNDYRFFIECGYLQWILKGGLVYLFLYVALFLLAIWQGFKSRNALCKASACIVLVQLVDMAPFGLHGFNTKMLMIWLAVSICLDKNFRKMTDEQVRDELFTIKNKLLPWQKK